MKLLLFLFSGAFVPFMMVAQQNYRHPEVFNENHYPKEKYLINIDSLTNKNCLLEVITVKPLKGANYFKVYIRRTITSLKPENNKIVIIEPVYSKLVRKGDVVYTPNPQPFNDKFIIASAIGKEETISVIFFKGINTHEIKGFNYAISPDSSFLYTRNRANDDFSQYNLKLGNSSRITRIPEKANLHFHEVRKEEILK